MRRRKQTATSGRRPAEPTTGAREISIAPLDNLVGYRLRLAYNVQVQRFGSVGGPASIRPQQFAALKLVYHNPDLKQFELSKILNKRHANIVTLLDELEERGLITRVADREDKRSRVLRLTDKGRSVTEKLIDRYKLLDSDLDRAFGVQARKQLVRLLDEFCKLNPDPDIDGPAKTRRTRPRSR